MISRVNTSWVIPVERPFVGWLARKLPIGVTPDHLTLTGFAGALNGVLSTFAGALEALRAQREG